MATGDKKINLYQKKLLPQQQMSDNFLDYLVKISTDTRKRVYTSKAGLFQAATLSRGSTSELFDIDIAEGVDNAGHEILLPTGIGIKTEIPFENAAATQYAVGMVHNSNRPYETEFNHKNGEPEYKLFGEVVGEVREPDSITDIPASKKLKIVVDTPLRCESAPFTHAGRLATVWLKNPQAGAESVAIVDATIQWDGSNNYIEVIYTDTQGPLGQSTISTTTSDYLTHIKGVTLTKTSILNLKNEAEYAFVGYINGQGIGIDPIYEDSDHQRIMTLAFGYFDLDGGYDGAAGNGSGRQVTIDKGAIELNTGSGGPGDEFRSFFRIFNDDRDFDIGIDLINAEYGLAGDTGSAASLVTRDKYRGSVSGAADPEFVQNGFCDLGLGTNTMTLPDGDYTNLYDGVCLITIENSPEDTDDGTYIVKSVSGTVVTVIDLEGNNPSFSNSRAAFKIYLLTNILGGAWNTVDAGSAERRWQNAFISNPAHTLATLRLAHPELSPPANMSALEIGNPYQAQANMAAYITYEGNYSFSGKALTDLTPDGTLDLGASGDRWDNLFATTVDATTIKATNWEGDLLAVGGSQDIGNGTTRWDNLFATTVDATTIKATNWEGDLLAAGGSQDIGNGTTRWDNLYTNNVDTVNIEADNWVNDLIPKTDLQSIGSITKSWQDIYVTNIDADYWDGNILAKSGGQNIGDGTTRWNTLYATTIDATNWNGNIIPVGDTQTIGSVGNVWDKIYANEIIGDISGSGSVTFDSWEGDFLPKNPGQDIGAPAGSEWELGYINTIHSTTTNATTTNATTVNATTVSVTDITSGGATISFNDKSIDELNAISGNDLYIGNSVNCDTIFTDLMSGPSVELFASTGNVHLNAGINDIDITAATINGANSLYFSSANQIRLDSNNSQDIELYSAANVILAANAGAGTVSITGTLNVNNNNINNVNTINIATANITTANITDIGSNIDMNDHSLDNVDSITGNPGETLVLISGNGTTGFNNDDLNNIGDITATNISATDAELTSITANASTKSLQWKQLSVVGGSEFVLTGS